MARVFISYRQTDSAGWAGRLYDRLRSRFGTDVAFRDVDSIPLGTDWRREIERALRSSDAVLVIIGPSWLSAESSDGSSRLDDPDDTLRREIEVSLQLAAEPKPLLLVIPVLVGGARLPEAPSLPDSLKDLGKHQKIALSEEAWLPGVARIETDIERFRTQKNPPGPDKWYQVYEVSARDLISTDRESFADQLKALGQALRADEDLILIMSARRTIIYYGLLAVSTSRLLWIDTDHVKWRTWSAGDIMRSGIDGQAIWIRQTDGAKVDFRLISYDAVSKASRALDRAGLLKEP